MLAFFEAVAYAAFWLAVALNVAALLWPWRNRGDAIFKTPTDARTLDALIRREADRRRYDLGAGQ